MTTLSDDLKNAIDKNLPQMVGKELQEVLQQAAGDAVELARAKEKIKVLERDNQTLERFKNKTDDLAALEKVLLDRERTLVLREKLLELSEKHAAERVNEIRALTHAVFQSNRFAYNVNLQTPNPMACTNLKDSYGNTIYQPQTLPTSGTVTKEG